jgi:putative endonuclease
METQYFLYVLTSVTHIRRYTGITNNLERRLKEHNSGKTKSTKGYRPWILVYAEEFETEEAAHKRELYLKSGIGREFLDAQLKIKNPQQFRRRNNRLGDY